MKMAKRKAKRSWAFRLVPAALLGALVLALSGDRGVYSAAPSGIDPLEVLNLAVRPNVLIVLDSSGSMREMPDADYVTDGFPDTPVEGELVGDDPNSKLAQAKTALRAVVTANQDKVSFQFGRYVQDATFSNYGPDQNDRFLYTKICANTDTACNNAANDILITNSSGYTCGGPECGIGLFRSAAFRRVGTTNTTYHLLANQFFNGQQITIRQNGSSWDAVVDTGDFGPSTAAPSGPGPWVEIRNRNNSSPFSLRSTAYVRFQFRGIRWAKGNTSASCGGFESLVGLAACTDNLQLGAIDPHLAPELELNPTTGNITGYTNTAVGAAVGAGQRPPMRGIRASGFTPIAESLLDFKTIFSGSIWPSVNIGGPTAPKPKTSVIFLTDGDDTCTGPTSSDSTPGTAADNRALRAAHKAQRLYERIVAADSASSVSTFVVVFGTGALANRANWIAWGGSGMNQPGTCGVAGKPACIALTGAATDPNTRWSTIPTAAQRAGCSTCRDAYLPTSTAALTAALQTAIDQGQAQGEFSDQQSITESIFELANLATAADPLDPDTRYDFTMPVLLQSTFEMPDFKGHLNAFRNQLVGTTETSLQMWDAGDKLTQRVQNSLGTSSWSFTQLRGGTSSTHANIGGITTAGTIRRRIYTTTRNGLFLTGSDATIVNNLTTANFMPPGQVAMWPPDAAVDPPGSAGVYPTGVLDDELGFMSLTLAELGTEFGACLADVAAQLPVDCRTTATAAVRLARARKEARQIILAWAAGADVVKNGTNPVRNPITFELQYQARAWLLAESTLAAPAIVTPPLQGNPAAHAAEYQFYRDGPRTSSDNAANGLSQGFGLRNPDKDAISGPATGADGRTDLKPVMSVVYHGANDMLHAFRAGNCPSNTCVGGATESGGDELWALVPYDQLGKLRDRMKPQARDPHTYVVAGPVRVADVFVPGSFSTTISGASVSGDGVWRTVILFGRGIAGKYFTAIDITSPGPFTHSALSTAPPIVMWNRGNPDTQDGTVTGTVNNSAADFTAYLKLGQTWSVPSVGFVTAANNTTPRRPGGVEFVAYAGSGYGNPAEGSTLFVMDMLTGDVIASHDVGDRGGMPYENAIVASPSGFNPQQLAAGSLIGNPAASKTTRMYVGDVHGRVWRMLTDAPGTAPLLFADLGSTQPVANGVALLDYAGNTTTKRPHIYVEAGNDNRVTPPPASTPPFYIFGLRDDDLPSDPSGSDGVNGPTTVLFRIPLPNGYRGTVQPATAFADAAGTLGRVFFAGTRFNLPGTANAPAPPPCRSSFDSIIFALGAQSGAAAYDLNASGDDRFTQITDQRVQAIRVAGGRLVIDTGLGAQNAPPPPAPPVANPPAPSPFSNVFNGATDPVTGLPRFVGLVPYKLGSSVCR